MKMKIVEWVSVLANMQEVRGKPEKVACHQTVGIVNMSRYKVIKKH